MTDTYHTGFVMGLLIGFFMALIGGMVGAIILESRLRSKGSTRVAPYHDVLPDFNE